MHFTSTKHIHISTIPDTDSAATKGHSQGSRTDVGAAEQPSATYTRSIAGAQCETYLQRTIRSTRDSQPSPLHELHRDCLRDAPSTLPDLQKPHGVCRLQLGFPWDFPIPRLLPTTPWDSQSLIGILLGVPEDPVGIPSPRPATQNSVTKCQMALRPWRRLDVSCPWQPAVLVCSKRPLLFAQSRAGFIQAPQHPSLLLKTPGESQCSTGIPMGSPNIPGCFPSLPWDSRCITSPQ